MSSYRAERVSQQIHQHISILVEREVADPRLAGVNVTRVQVSGDLRIAKILVAPNSAGADATREMMDGLEHAKGFFRRQLARNLDLRLAPEIRFLVDHAIEKGERFLKVLEQVQAEEHTAKETDHAIKNISTKGNRRQTDDR